MKRLARIASAFAALCTGLAPVEAATITATFDGSLFGNTITRTIVDGPSYGLPGGPTNLTVSLFHFTTSSGGFYAYCIEPQQGVGSGTFTLDPTFALVPGNISPTTLTPAKIASLKLFLGQVSNPFSPTLDQYIQAAMQVGIWEIVRETASTYNVASGNVTFTGGSHASILTLAQGYLDNVNNNIGTPNHAIMGLYNSTLQDVVTNTPEPGTMLLLGLGFIGLGLAGRKKG